jgi:6-phosphogluconate dehydrogenase (decarboxylating)
MELGMIGLGPMGTNMVRRLLRAGHQCVVYPQSRVHRNDRATNDPRRDSMVL